MFLFGKKIKTLSLVDRYLIPPFNVFDMTKRYWLKRRHYWLNLGIQSDIRSNVKSKVYNTDTIKFKKIKFHLVFDPVLCEVIYNWFVPKGGKILDPFAGDCVRGIVASYLGFKYVGIDLNPVQIEENIKKAKKICNGNKFMPRWILGDSFEVDKILEDDDFDFIFTCPPYFNLEIYTDNQSDLSNFKCYRKFLTRYKQIFNKCVKKLKMNRFVCLVVGDFRDELGFLRKFPCHNILIFSSLGFELYNRIILLKPIGTLPIRTAINFKYRKLGNRYEEVLCFYRGDHKGLKELFNE